jgi:two-component system response regulator HydG
VVPVPVPPLRERVDDIPLLVEHFVKRAGAPARTFSEEAMAQLCAYHWPGNVRELENLVKRLLVVSTAAVLDVAELGRHAASLLEAPPPLRRDRVVPLRQIEDEYISWAVEKCGGNKTRAAELLGIDVSTIHRREKAR